MNNLNSQSIQSTYKTSLCCTLLRAMTCRCLIDGVSFWRTPPPLCNAFVKTLVLQSKMSPVICTIAVYRFIPVSLSYTYLQVSTIFPTALFRLDGVQRTIGQLQPTTLNTRRCLIPYFTDPMAELRCFKAASFGAWLYFASVRAKLTLLGDHPSMHRCWERSGC